MNEFIQVQTVANGIFRIPAVLLNDLCPGLGVRHKSSCCWMLKCIYLCHIFYSGGRSVVKRFNDIFFPELVEDLVFMSLC